MWWGKVIGFIIGYWLAGSVGAVFGVFLGHLVDIYRQQPWTSAFRQAHASMQQMRQAFFDATFLVMGHIAKADGLVTEQELDASRYIMQRMALNELQKRQAMHLFNAGKQSEFDLDSTLTRLIQFCRGNVILLQMFVDIQVQAARMSGPMNAQKQKILNHIFQRLGYAPFEFRSANYRYQQRAYAGSYTESPGNKLKSAYQLLNVPETASEAEIKRAYRRLMSQHHPDKLFAKGLPEEMMKLATEKAQQIQLAYELIREARGFKVAG